ncbi:Protein high chlorophyll fluorescent 107 [Dichanthelium oligosanthes]|uniref:Protein high chlorophyll fluorescent 107 n=1 Tax=Dichanthelium oligosanthes TaxID=888268 RepID=A0A1E5VU77_9POAL|nr:Protein high chlorophyll fluorescent 107 [Dichanthelium oligosanthes]
MADPVDDAAAAAADDDEVEDLYADLDEQVTAALAAAGESGGSSARDSDPATDGEVELPEADANEAVDLGEGTGYSSSDESDDGLHIVLNEDAGAPPLPPPPVGCGEGCTSLSADPNPALYYFSTIFDINIEALQQKPWRQHGVDLTDYFNFGLDEEGWGKYWCSMKQLRLGTRSLANETSGLGQVRHKPWMLTIFLVNMVLSPSNQSTLDDSSKLNHKCVTTERMSIDHPGARRLKGSSFVVDRVVDKEVHDGDSSEYSGSERDRRDSSCARGQSSSPDYSDTVSVESKDDFYFKRANIHSDSRAKLQDEHVKSDFYRHSCKSDRENSESCNRSYTPSPADDRNHKATKLLWRGEAPFAGRGKSSNFFVDCESDHDLLKSGHTARKELKRQSVDGGRYTIFVEKEKSTDSYPGRYDKKYGKRRSSSSSLRTNYHNAVHNQFYEKQDYSPLERVALKNDKHYFSKESNHHHRRFSLREIRKGENVEKCFSSAKEWQQHHDHVYHSMLNADMSDADDGRMGRERYCQEKRRARHGHGVDDEFPHYTDYGFCEWQSPEARGRYKDKGRFAKSNDEHFRHANHLELYPSLNDSERDWPAAGFHFKSSRNRCIDNKRIRNAKMEQYHCDGYHQKNNANIPRSALCSDTVAETGCFILPVKRKLHADLGSMNQKNLADLSLLKGRRLMHDQSMVSDRRIYALKLHKFTEEIDTEAICNSSDMRNSNTDSNICVGRRHGLENADNIRLDDRKIKFERRGNELRRVIENDQKGRLPVGKALHSSKHKHVHQNAQKQNMSYHHSGNQDLEKSAYQNRQNEEDGEIEEGELIEQDHQDIISKSRLKPRKVVLKSVIETGSAEQLQVNDAMLKDAVCTIGATRECDKHILELMEKMQKRRERFKEAIAPKKEDGDKKELLAVAYSTDYIQNQRPARKRRWGADGADAVFLDQCISFWPEDGRPYVALGKLYGKQSRYDKSRAVYERGCQATQGENPYIWQKAVQASPKNRFSWHVWALFEANEGNIDRGRKLLKIGHAVNPRDPVILQSLALLEYSYSSSNIARVLFRKASQIDPRHQPVWIAWGVLEQRAGNYTAARRLLRSSLSINSQSEVTWMTWAALEEEQGDPVRAEEIRNLYFQQRIEVVDDASWVMGFLDIIDPALDSVKKLLNLDQPSGSVRRDTIKSTTELSPTRSSAAESSSETSATGASDASGLSNNDADNSGSEAKETPGNDFDLDGFIKKRLGLDPAELDAVLEGSDPRGVVSQRRKRRLPRKPLPLLPVP